jgi:glycosyltransferase involved in cell wall biosynthesis
VINDGSTDSSPIILEEYKKSDNRIRVINNERNIGLTKSLNNGVAIAEGKYIARMDADDLSLSYRFERQLDFLEKNPSFVAVGSAYYQLDENSKIESFMPVLSDYKEIKDGFAMEAL